LIGTPPNVAYVAFVKGKYNYTIDFFSVDGHLYAFEFAFVVYALFCFSKMDLS